MKGILESRGEYRCTVKGARDASGSGSVYCAEDDYTDAWSTTDTILMLHGIAETSAMWRPWVPSFARRHRVLRVDLRGFGKSTAMPDGFAIVNWADDITQLAAALGRTRVHLVGTKLGALVAFEIAQRRPTWVASMTLAGMLPSPKKALGPWLDEWIAMVEGPENGVRRWSEATMLGRMGNSLSPQAMQWWTDLMGEASADSVAACLRLLHSIDGPSNPGRVQCPVMFLAAGAPRAAGASYNQRPSLLDLERLQKSVPHSSLVEIAADSYHIAATHPDACAAATAAFIGSL